MLCDVGEGFVCHRVDGFDLERLHEALRLGVIVRIAAPAHRADQAVTKQGFPIVLRSVLRTAVCVMDATWRRLSPLDRDVKRGKRQANVDRAAAVNGAAIFLKSGGAKFPSLAGCGDQPLT
jgi:hypothetical protein